MAAITVTPDEPLMDDKLTIVVSGLRRHEAVTLYAVLTNDKKTFASCASYVADGSGTVDLENSSSTQGTYTGVEPMGLFWSMVQSPGQPRGTRITHKHVSLPLDTHISVFPGQVTLDQLFLRQDMEAIAKTTVSRWYKSRSVTRHPIKAGRLRGVLFLPPGEEPAPGVIDLFGMIGGLVEFRAALLASRGFVVLALAYVGYKDLPLPCYLNLSYFQEAVDWLSCHPRVRTGGLGVVGVSKGGEIGHVMARYMPEVKVLVAISAPTYYVFPGIRHPDDKRHERDILHVISIPILLFEAWRGDAKILSILGEDDQSMNIGLHQRLWNTIPADKKANMEMVTYPGAGHLIEPPYTPHYPSSYNNFMDVWLAWGGTPKPHADAQEKSWRRILQFLNTHLQMNSEQKFAPGSKL
ncbi:hypothetical protein ScPMuIL_014409 [Solemya velum]